MDLSSEIDLMSSPGKAQYVARRTKELGPGIGRRMREAREHHGMSQRDLAKLAHCTQVTVGALESGSGGNSSIGLYADIARALNVSPEWLCFGVGEGPQGQERQRDLGRALGARLKEARKKRGLTIGQLADRAQASPTAVRAIEAGEGATTSLALLADLAQALSVAPCWLCYGEGDGPGEKQP